MRIGFDIRPFLKQATGVGVYYKNLLSALAAIDHKNTYFLFSSSLKDRFPRDGLPSFSRRKFRDMRYPVRMLNYLWRSWQWPALDSFFREDLDLTHSPIPLILPTKGKKIVTVYDLFFMEHPHLVGREAGKVFRGRIGDSLKEADGILTISQFVKIQILDRFGIEERKIRAIHLGVDAAFSESPAEETLKNVKQKYALPPSFLLFVGNIDPRKNLPRLIEALALLGRGKKRIPLVIAGRRGRDYRSVLDSIRRHALESQVYLLDFLPLLDLRVLYRLATALVLPSLSEGFGLPVVEAMASGLPCVLSRAPALPEIAQQAALFFDPQSAEDMAQAIGLLVADEELRADLIAKGRRRAVEFSWERTAEETLLFYKTIGEGEGAN